MDFRASTAQDNAHRMIYIADLPRHTSYLDISDFYEKNVGPCQICIKRPLFKNFYYAFVMFESIENAKKAVAEFRFPRIKGPLMSRALPYNLHAIRGEPGGRDVQTTSIFVKGFQPLKWNHEDLYAKFCEFGKILSCKVSVSPEHEFLGYGYIQFSKIEEAQKAIDQMDKYDLAQEAKTDAERDGLRGEQVTVLEYHTGAKKSSRRAFNNVYVKNFPKESSFTEESLRQLFSEFGEVSSTAIMRDANGESKGFGFVCFKEPTTAERAIQAVQKHEAAAADDGEAKESDGLIHGVRLSDLYVREAKKKSVRMAELQMSNFKYKKSIMFFSLFVKNFPVGTTEEELRIYFQTACQGEVSRVNIVKGTQQAFVNFEKQDQCKMAKEFARNVLFKSQYALYVEYCYPKEMRSIRNEEIHDKRAQDRKRQQQSQAQIASLSGSQNLIDLLTLLLKPAFQLNQAGSMNGRRSHSLNPMSNRVQGYGQNQQMGRTDGMQQPRHQNRNRYPSQQHQHQQQQMGQMMQPRHHASAMPPAGMPQPMPVLQHQMPTQSMIASQQAMLGQRVAPMQQMAPGVSAGSNSVDAVSTSNASSAQPAPQYVEAAYAQQYFVEVRNMYASAEYKKAGSRAQQKELIGNTIYKHVERLVGEKKAPKITGMLIDLPEIELNYSIIQWTEFEQKVMSALQMISRNEGPQEPAASTSAAAAQSESHS